MEQKKGLPKYGKKTDLERARARKIDSLLGIKKHKIKSEKKIENKKDSEIIFEIWKDMNKQERKDYISEIKNRLISAFIALEEEKKFKIYTGMNFEDCQSCGVSMIHQQTKGSDFAGYVFYHMQDEEDLLEKGFLYLSYGELDDSSIKVVKKIIKALNDVGLIIEWNGKLNIRILIIGFKTKNKQFMIKRVD